MDILLLVIVVGIVAAAIWGFKRSASKTEVETFSQPEVATVQESPPVLTVVTAEENPVAKEEKKKYKQGAKKPSKKKAVTKKPAKAPAKKTKKSEA
jgi:hypothetical protein